MTGFTSGMRSSLTDQWATPQYVYDGSDFPEDEEEFDEKMSLRKSEGWESIGHISRDGLHVEILFMDVRK